MKLGQHFLLVPLFFLAYGCTTYAWKSNPPTQTISSEYLYATITPVCSHVGCTAFRLSVQNKTDKSLEINWNKTFYVYRGQTSGGFMFEGVLFRDRNSPKPADVVFADSTFSKVIWPNNLVEFSSNWYHRLMPAGEQGVYLSVTVDGKEINEKLTLTLAKVKN